MDIALAIYQINPAAEYRLNEQGNAIAEWRGPGLEPTPAQLQAAWDAYEAAKTLEEDNSAALRALVLGTAQSAVGLSYGVLTTGQMRALLACLLYQAGALDTQGIIQPLNSWLR